MMTTEIIITLSTEIPLGIRWMVSIIILVVRERMLMVIVGILMRMMMRVKVRKLVLSMIERMMHVVAATNVTMTMMNLMMKIAVAVIVVRITMRNGFVLCHVQPRHFLSIQDLQVLKTLGARSAPTKQIQTPPQCGQCHSRSGMW